MKITAKIIKCGAAVLVLAAVLAVVYHVSYPIKLNAVTLPTHIAEFYNRGRSAPVDPSEITVYDGVEIGNRAWYLLELGEDLGSVTLEKGLTGRYRIKSLGYGSGNFRDGIVESGGKKYLLFGGRDLAARIARVTVSLDGRAYEVENPNPGDHFLLCAEVDPRTEDNHIGLDRLSFYNKDGEDITGLYNLSGGGI